MKLPVTDFFLDILVYLHALGYLWRVHYRFNGFSNSNVFELNGVGLDDFLYHI